MNSVIFISNPFGFGPSGRTLSVMEELAVRWNGKIIFAASEKCQEILTDELKKRVEIVTIDERNEMELQRFLFRHKNSLVVVSLNKVAVKTAKQLGIKCVLIDSLAWMWKSIPKEYLLADTYYYYNLFGAAEKLSGVANAKPIPPALGQLPESLTRRNHEFVVHVGGLMNPYGLDIPEAYLRLIGDAIGEISDARRIVVTGGEQVVYYLQKIVWPRPNVSFATLERDNFLKLVNTASRLVTTSGSMATLEAFAMGTPVAFLLPTNLSQWKQLKLLTQAGAAPLHAGWEMFVSAQRDFDGLSEEEAMKEFRLLASRIYQDRELRSRAVTALRALFNDSLDTSGQRRFIQETGRNGSSVIVVDILKLLRVSGS